MTRKARALVAELRCIATYAPLTRAERAIVEEAAYAIAMQDDVGDQSTERRTQGGGR